MDAEELLRQQIQQEGEVISINLLNELGNRAVELGLIAGHGYRDNKYEILRQSQAIILSPKEAQSYLQNLIAEIEQ